GVRASREALDRGRDRLAPGAASTIRRVGGRHPGHHRGDAVDPPGGASGGGARQPRGAAGAADRVGVPADRCGRGAPSGADGTRRLGRRPHAASPETPLTGSVTRLRIHAGPAKGGENVTHRDRALGYRRGFVAAAGAAGLFTVVAFLFGIHAVAATGITITSGGCSGGGSSYCFNPESASGTTGSAVTWTNQSGVDHTA